MEISQLRQYRYLIKEQEVLEQKIKRYRNRIAKLPDIYDKVNASDPEWPYTSVHIPVKAKPPKETEELNRLIRLNEERQQSVIELLLEIEEYIKGIPDSESRQIFEMVFIDGKTYRETGDKLNMDASTVARKIYMQLGMEL